MSRNRLAALSVTLLVSLFLAMSMGTSVLGSQPGQPSQRAKGDIPRGLLPLYQAAANTCPGLPWSVLAAIGKVESDHGRSPAPGVRSGVNRFGCCAGPMQFNIRNGPPSTWDTYGRGGNVYDPRDAIPAAARLLCANGAQGGRDVRGAVYAYNHASWYVTKVLAIASTYAASEGLPPGAPAEQVAAAAVQFAYNQLGRPYQWGATGELGFYDCSGLMLRAYQAGGLTLPRTSRQQWYAGARVWNVADLLPGDLVFYADNPADPATIHHVGIYIGAGNMIDAPYTGATVRITPFLRGDYIGAVRPTAGRAPAGASATPTPTTAVPGG